MDDGRVAIGTGMKRDLILFGPPGAGKGTQGALLAERFDLRRLATGDVLRDAVKHGTPLGREARRYMDAGELVPDEVILGIVRDYLTSEGANRGVIFDGFPRTIPQAEGLAALLADLGRPLEAVLVLDVDDEALVKRLSGRRSCADCGAGYNVYFDPPQRAGTCDVCGGELTSRPDDDAATVRRRLEVYREQTLPLVEHYEGTTVPVRHLDGDRPVPDVQRELVGMLES
jgi:adenylate kinase